jgi:hypothetical protein
MLMTIVHVQAEVALVAFNGKDNGTHELSLQLS